ncbi:unnamed protein product, partial [Mesorhabditis belari]|uniref:Phospholipid/glycerol acyltransferase domain-containing protein n=1 Tax=Mesorhabditis belari TaxID=2138241 RepID=A0AAF3FQI3_9BILA
MGPFFEHIIFASAFLFPPVALTVLLCLVLATFGKSLGLRKLYVNTLIAIFEWGARQIKTTKKMEKIKRGESSAQLFNLGDCLSSSDDEQPSDDNEVRSDGYESGSGMRRRHGSGTSVCSVSSVCSRTEPALLRKNSIIRRETQIQFDEDEDDGEVLVNSRGWAVMRDSIDFVKAGIESIIEDEVTSRFEAEQLASWNMLTRTSIRFYQFVNWKLTVLYSLGFLLRYCVLLPLRISIFSIGLVFLVVSTAIIGLFPDGALKRRLNFNCMLICYRILSRSVSAVVHFHDEHNRPPGSGIAVANHTSPMDAMILSTDNVYALIGQRHPGILGLVQRALSRASSHIWFERSEAKDRATVAHMLREHVSDVNKLPILIFPEGTCINNTSVMMFKKGSFEVGATIFPIAMKYDSRFGDPFWNSSEQTWAEYLLRMQTSWAIICNVWYLPPMRIHEGEDAIDFANRVKKAIAQKGGLVDLEWDGQLKRSRVPPKLVRKQQEKYCHRFARYTSTSDGLRANAEAEDDGEYITFKSPGVSGYNSLEELPEDVIVSSDEDEGTIPEDAIPTRQRRRHARSDNDVDDVLLSPITSQ